MQIRDFRKEILDAVHIFVSETGIAEGSLGSKACRESRVVQWLRDGRNVTMERYQLLWNFMAAERKRREKAAKAEEPQP